MTDEIVLTEEILKEFLDPVSAKAFPWQQEKESGYASMKFQASFVDDHEKKYFLSFYRNAGLGKTSREVIFSVKKNKNLNPKINIDKGSFIKLLGSIIQVYEFYKLNDPDGKMSNSYGFQFPDSLAKYMPFVVKVIKRLFKTNPKVRLSLYGAVESFEGNTILYYVNQSSSMPFFGGPKAELKDIRGPFYLSLSGNHEETDSVGQKTHKDVSGDIDLDNFKLDVKPVKASILDAAKKAKPTTKTTNPDKEAPKPFEEEPVKAPEGFQPTGPGQIGWVDPIYGIDFGGTIKADKIVMKMDSGSSSLKKGDEAKIFGFYLKSKFEKCYKQFGISENIKDNLIKTLQIIIVIPSKDSKKYVGLPCNSEITSNFFEIPQYYLLNSKTGKTSPLDNSKTKMHSYEDFKEIPKKEDAKTFELPYTFIEALRNVKVKIGPVEIAIGDDLSLIGLSEKLKEVEGYFGKLPAKKIEQIAYQGKVSLDQHEREITIVLNKYLDENGLFFGDGTDKDNVNAVKKYTGPHYGIVNKFLRGEKLSPGDSTTSADIVTKMDKGFADDGVRFPKNLNVYRGASISQDDITKLNDAKKIPLTGYASVSFRPNIAYAFGNIGSYVQDVVRGALIDFDDIKNKETLSSAEFSSRQGNKILYTINRLDRCLSIAVDKISLNQGEDEIILNRGTQVQMRLGMKVQKVLDRKKSFQDGYGADALPEHGIWIAKVEIAPNAISESTLKSYLLREAIQKVSEVQDNLAIAAFYLEDVLSDFKK